MKINIGKIDISKFKILFFVKYLVILVIVYIAAIQVLQQPKIELQAAGRGDIHLELSSTPQSVKVGEDFVVQLTIFNPASKDISAVDIVFLYDTDLLQFTKTSLSAGWELVYSKSTDNYGTRVVIVNKDASEILTRFSRPAKIHFRLKAKGAGNISAENVTITSNGESKPLEIDKEMNRKATFTTTTPTGTIIITSTPTPTSTPQPCNSPNYCASTGECLNDRGNNLGSMTCVPDICCQPPAQINTPTPTEKSDLDVTYIELLPRYERYDVRYEYDKNGQTLFPFLRPGTQDNKRESRIGETVTFIAHFKNKGSALSKKFSFRWIMDGTEVKSGVRNGLNKDEEGEEKFSWDWQNSSHMLKFTIDSGDSKLEDANKANNTRKTSTDALTFKIFVEQTIYDTFNNNMNFVGTYSFEDWVQAHADLLNQKLAYSNVNERIRIDKIDVVKDNTLPKVSPPLDLLFDGIWHFIAGWNKSDLLDWTLKIDPGLIHEWSHQLGIAHSADANIDIESDNLITGRRLIQSDPAISGQQRCCDDVGYSVGTNQPFVEYFLRAVNVNKGYRRGYYGDYLFDVPETNVLKIRDASNEPLANAQIKVWQSSNQRVSGNPIFTGVTDVKGEYALPNQFVRPITTATGHTLKSNPFGNIDVNSRNGLFLIEITVNNEREYAALTIHNFNLLYWRGSKDYAEHIIPTTLLHNADSTNIASKKLVSASSNSDKGTAVVDGDANLYWEPTNRDGKIGDWIKVDLGEIKTLYKINIYSSKINFHDWYKKFHIEISVTGAFQGEQKRVATEIDWDQSRNAGRKEGGVVSYVFSPVNARYIRVVSDVDQGFVKLAELEAFSVF